MTNKEIAEKLGISPTALSLIINHKKGVSNKTRNSVINEIIKMGQEDIIKPITKNGIKNICFVIYLKHGKILNSHPFFLLLMETIETYTRKLGYNTILFTFDERQSKKAQISHLHSLELQGIILFATEMTDDDLKPFKSIGIPIVAIDNEFSCSKLTTIAIDNRMGTFQAISRLIKAGITRIGYLRSKVRISSFCEREKGYQNALNYYQSSFMPKSVIDISYSEEGSYRDFISIFQNVAAHKYLPEAFVCDDDTIALGALRAMHELGFKVPDDISIIGFNNRPSTNLTNPSLTTINVPKEALALSAVDELIRLINKKQEKYVKKIRIGTEIVERNSVKSVK